MEPESTDSPQSRTKLAAVDARLFLLGNAGQNGQNTIAERSQAIQILLAITAPVHAIASKPLQMLQGLQRAFSAEPIQCPKQNKFEFPHSGVFHHLLESRSLLGAAADFIRVFLGDAPALPLAVLA
jgi:hypothetical protein